MYIIIISFTDIDKIPSKPTLSRIINMIDGGKVATVIIEIMRKNIGNTGNIVAVDGKTMCSSGNKDHKSHHIVSVWSKSDGFCLEQRAINEKSNEITAIPELLKEISIKYDIVPIDAMGMQIEISKQIIATSF